MGKLLCNTGKQPKYRLSPRKAEELEAALVEKYGEEGIEAMPNPGQGTVLAAQLTIGKGNVQLFNSSALTATGELVEFVAGFPGVQVISQ